MNTIGKRVVYVGAGVAALAGSIIFYSGEAASKDDRPRLVKVGRILKLAALCQTWVGPTARDRLETALRDRVWTNNPVDHDDAAIAIREGQTDALLDFKASALSTCGTLTRDDFQDVSDYLAGRRKLSTASMKR